MLKLKGVSLYFFWSLGLINIQAQQTREGVSREIVPGDVYQTVSTLREEIDLIRQEMGKPLPGPVIVQVENASPREVYYQGRSLYRKAARLALEICREEVAEPGMPFGELQPRDVKSIVESAAARIGKVKSILEIPEIPESPPLDSEISPTDVYNSILSANRELNLLLDRRFAPGDVYEEISVAIAYASRLLDSPERVETPPDPPAFVRKKRPAEVYRELAKTFEEIQEITELSGIEMLSLAVDENQLPGAEPADVYDLASLIVSELAYFHSLKKGALPPRSVYPSGRKLPSHVYQRLGVLREQIRMLREKVETNPDWLKNG